MSSTLELSPSSRSISLFKICQIADTGPDRDDLDSFNLANDFKFHSSSVLSDNFIQVLQDGHGFLSLSPVVKCSQTGAETIKLICEQPPVQTLEFPEALMRLLVELNAWLGMGAQFGGITRSAFLLTSPDDAPVA
jgi:hypothetical protein